MFGINLPARRESGLDLLRTFGANRSRSLKCPRSARPAVEPLEGRARLSPGALDTNFGGTGMVTTAIQQDSGSRAVAVQSDSKVVVMGESNDRSLPDHFTIARYNANGSLDSRFGNGGIVIIHLSNTASSDGATAVAIQPADGKSVVAGGFDIPSILAGKGKRSTSPLDARLQQVTTAGSGDRPARDRCGVRQASSKRSRLAVLPALPGA